MDIWQSALESEEGRGFVLKRREGRTREINREGDREEWEGGDARERNALGGQWRGGSLCVAISKPGAQ